MKWDHVYQWKKNFRLKERQKRILLQLFMEAENSGKK